MGKVPKPTLFSPHWDLLRDNLKLLPSSFRSLPKSAEVRGSPLADSGTYESGAANLSTSEMFFSWELQSASQQQHWGISTWV